MNKLRDSVFNLKSKSNIIIKDTKLKIEYYLTKLEDNESTIHSVLYEISEASNSFLSVEGMGICKAGLLLEDARKGILYGVEYKLQPSYKANIDINEKTISNVYDTLYKEISSNSVYNYTIKRDISYVDDFLYNRYKCPSSVSHILNTIFILRTFPIFNIFMYYFKTKIENNTYNHQLDLRVYETTDIDSYLMRDLVAKDPQLYANNIISLLSADTNLLNYNIVTERNLNFFPGIMELIFNNLDESQTKYPHEFIIIRELKYKYRIYKGNIDFFPRPSIISNGKFTEDTLIATEKLLRDIQNGNVTLSEEDLDVLDTRGKIRIWFNILELIQYFASINRSVSFNMSFPELHKLFGDPQYLKTLHDNVNIYLDDIIKLISDYWYFNTNYVRFPYKLEKDDINDCFYEATARMSQLKSSIYFLNQIKKYMLDDDLCNLLIFSNLTYIVYTHTDKPNSLCKLIKEILLKSKVYTPNFIIDIKLNNY